MTTTRDTAALETIRETVDMAAGKVFGEPIHRDGTTVLPVAAVATGGGGGGGSGSSSAGSNATGRDAGGEGGGFGVVAKPAGAFVIRDGAVSWNPALDLNRVILGGQIVAVVALLVIRGIFKARAKQRHHHHLRRHARHRHPGPHAAH
jgi:uncharacterized spore protein YtfJ